LQNFIYQLKPARPEMVDTPTESEIRIVGEHFEYLKQMLDQDRLILAGRTEGAEFGIVIFESENLATATDVMTHDPAIVQGVMSGEIFPYRLAFWRRH